jgi:electron transport complex protein RnfC
LRYKTFPQGIHLRYHKQATAGKPTVTAKAPAVAVVPLIQHIGVPCIPQINVGDHVFMGQKIGDAEALITAPIHSPISGKVMALEARPHVMRRDVLSVVIENDGEDELYPDIMPYPDWERLDPDTLRNIIREGGIVGMGGAAFPTHIKLAPQSDKSIDAVLINGAECEDYLTDDNCLMVERPEWVIGGARIISHILGNVKIVVGIEANKPDALAAIRQAAGEGDDISVIALDTKYPQGGEKQMVKALLDREVPSGGLPSEVGVVVNNVATVAKIFELITTGMPLISRGVTLSGPGVSAPGNLIARIGTSMEDLISECGGYKGKIAKVIMGGPMTGISVFTTLVTLTKSIGGVVVMRHEDICHEDPVVCIRCARCVDACPVYLMPISLYHYSRSLNYDQAVEAYGLFDCIECGCCSYVCPGRLPLMESIKHAKAEINNKRQKQHGR